MMTHFLKEVGTTEVARDSLKMDVKMDCCPHINSHEGF